MGADVVIRAERLGKKYLIGHLTRREPYGALRDVIARSAQQFARAAGDMLRGRPLVQGDEVEEFWALKDVSFEVARGDVVGVIGRNGAGKSTLLKVLSRITEPSAGRVEIKGRVASLLEVGTGFHSELTGRENIYLNGAILGMTRDEIRRKFDEIVAFAEIEKFLDTPVKRYSSGMYVRLAFAVAAHLEPEILVVDEVLAVGDAEFQKKCLGKMQDVAAGGRTILFVSHNLSAVASLCRRGIVLRDGGVVVDDDVSKALAAYMEDRSRTGNAVRGRKIDLMAEASPAGDAQGVVLTFEITLRGPLKDPRVSIGVNDQQGLRVATVFTETAARLPPVAKGDSLTFRMTTSPVCLSPDVVFLKVGLIEEGRDIEMHEDAVRVVIPDYSPFRNAPLGHPRGVILLPAATIVELQHALLDEA